MSTIFDGMERRKMARRQWQYLQTSKASKEEEMQAQYPRKRYTYANQKGGVTKTTKAANYGIAATMCGKRVLAVDVDHGQGNLTYALGYTQWKLKHTVYTVMTGDSTPDQAILPTYYDPQTGIFFDPQDSQQMSELGLSSLEQAVRGPDLLPMNPDLCNGADFELIQRGDWGQLLCQMLDDLQGHYDEMHLDTNPDIKSVFPKSAVYAATDVVIPTTPENWSIQGLIMLAQFLMQARAVNERFNVAGVFFARIRYSAHREMMRIAREEVIPSINQMIEEAQKEAQRQHKSRLVRQLQGLQFHCFENIDSESKEHSNQTLSRSTVMTANKTKKGELAPALEQWNCYIELLQRTGGSGIEQAMTHYNALIDQYDQARN
jgi:chromosome partitioning protein